MTDLRERMLEDVQLRRFALKTKKAYLKVIRQLAEHFDKSVSDITEDGLWQYWHISRHPRWLFPARTSNEAPLSKAGGHISTSAPQKSIRIYPCL
jgi:hypothetical protein